VSSCPVHDCPSLGCCPVETGSRGALRLRGGAPGSAAGFRVSPEEYPSPVGLGHLASLPRPAPPDARHGWGSGSNAGYRGPDRAGRRSLVRAPRAMTSQARKQNGGVRIPEPATLIDTVDWTREVPDSDPVMSMQKSQKPQTTVGQEGSASRQAGWAQPDMSFSVLLSIFLCLHISGVALRNST
uniref:Uncharacterized protein n=1 Tax=Nomascus leucogenys TaxID=61853 RepID=A0A2I3H1F2_NOMLE